MVDSSPEIKDALTDVLRTLRLQGTTYFCSYFESPWAMLEEKTDACMFHVVLEGNCWLRTDQDNPPIQLVAGDIIAFPTGADHWMGDELESASMPGDKVMAEILAGKHPFQSSAVTKGGKENNAQISQPRTRLMCGSFSYDSSINHPLLKDLPCYILVNSRQSEGGWLKLLVDVMASETLEPAPGSAVIVDRLAEVLFVQLLRAHIQTTPGAIRYMNALLHPQIGRALNLIHSEQQANLTVQTLGEKVGLSRTVFAEKFIQLVGISVKNYLTDWRMHKAKLALATSNRLMFSIAEMAGYSSEAAFARAFKNFFDMTPGQVRRG
ncbi:MAG: AraC family transcriptional regulator [Pseudomonadales bacterium]|nr:AraC family transcriptional regulator [Pseudomonadales bacterium]